MYVFACIIYTFPPTTVGVYKLVVSSPSGAKVDKQLELTVLGEGETVDAEDLDFSSVPVAQFGAYVNDYHNNSNEKFRDHYKVCHHVFISKVYHHVCMYHYITTYHHVYMYQYKVYHHVYMYHYKVCYNISSSCVCACTCGYSACVN